ncbi:MAG: DUF6428 family protein [Brumimicrobium sp.]|nr:DUF6428 family protein [Brumimicrobium sp.]
MKLSEVKKALENLNELKFKLPGGEFVPDHFHVTEIGTISRHFIDCGGTEGHEKTINFQLWQADDFDHRLAPQKLKNIIELSEEKLGLGNSEVEVEYQMETIGKFDLAFDGKHFELRAKQTDCLSREKCGISEGKQKVSLMDLGNSAGNSCTPGSGCC